jgi:signal transduction histidine kinase
MSDGFEVVAERRTHQANVLILSDENEFPRTLIARWQTERIVPAFTVMSSDLWTGGGDAECEVAVVGSVRSGRLGPILKSLDSPSRPTICVVADLPTLKSVREQHGRVLVMRQSEEWADTVVLIAREGLRRAEVQARLRRAEQAATNAEPEALLGRYMLEMRHGLNNALTSVLGNAELLLLQPHAFTPEVCEQIETIRAMSLRIHEILRRFSSLESEMQFTEKPSQGETRMVSHGVQPIR